MRRKQTKNRFQQLVFRTLSVTFGSAQLLKEHVAECTSCFAPAGSPPPSHCCSGGGWICIRSLWVGAPCHTGDSNPRQYCAWLFSPTLYPLSYIPRLDAESTAMVMSRKWSCDKHSLIHHSNKVWFTIHITCHFNFEGGWVAFLRQHFPTTGIGDEGGRRNILSGLRWNG